VLVYRGDHDECISNCIKINDLLDVDTTTTEPINGQVLADSFSPDIIIVRAEVFGCDGGGVVAEPFDSFWGFLGGLVMKLG